MKIKHLSLVLLIIPFIQSCAGFWYMDYQIPRGELYKPSSVPKIIKALDDKNQNVRIRAAQTIQYIGPEAKEAVPALIKASEDTNVAYYTILALGAIGSEAKESIPLLVSYLRNDDLRYYAADAIEKIGITGKESVLVESLKKDVLTKHYYDQYAAAKVLDSMNLDAKEISVNDKYQIAIKVKPIIRTIFYEKNYEEFQFRHWGFLPIHFSFENKTKEEISIEPNNIRVFDSKNNSLVILNTKDLVDQFQKRVSYTVLFTGIFAASGINRTSNALEEYVKINSLPKKNLKTNEKVEGAVFYRINDDLEESNLENYRVIVPYKNRKNEDIFSITTDLYGDVIKIDYKRELIIEQKEIINQGDMESKVDQLRILLKKGLISQEEFNSMIIKLTEPKI